jgi:hypothetical protein
MAGYMPVAFELRSHGGSAGYGQSGPDDAVGPQHADAEIGDMHRAAFALAVAGLLAVDLGHHLLHVRALGYAVAVAAVVAYEAVLNTQVLAHPCGDGFLPDVGVDEADDVAGIELSHHSLLEATDGKHRRVQIDECLIIQDHWQPPTFTDFRRS